ncbi:Meiosis-specific coiled-coil domain-containing protein MEIOC [Nymphon striatum]|nr:Meiosis-specific coiled-coil domain-containing protein MEIOC [Nymphon striatum]
MKFKQIVYALLFISGIKKSTNQAGAKSTPEFWSTIFQDHKEDLSNLLNQSLDFIINAGLDQNLMKTDQTSILPINPKQTLISPKSWNFEALLPITTGNNYSDIRMSQEAGQTLISPKLWNFEALMPTTAKNNYSDIRMYQEASQTPAKASNYFLQNVPQVPNPLFYPMKNLINNQGLMQSNMIPNGALTMNVGSESSPTNQYLQLLDQWLIWHQRLEKERQLVEEEIGSKWPNVKISSINNFPTPKVPHNPSRIDYLIVDQLKEHSRVLTLFAKMRITFSYKMDEVDEVEVVSNWVDEIRKIKSLHEFQANCSAPTFSLEGMNDLIMCTKEVIRSCRAVCTRLWISKTILDPANGILINHEA